MFVASFALFLPTLKASTPVAVTPKEALILLLYPEAEKVVRDYSKDYISDGPHVAPYSIAIKSLSHTPNIKGAYHYTIILEVRPYVGAHVNVGLDKITFTISLNGIESILFEHHVLTPLP